MIKFYYFFFLLPVIGISQPVLTNSIVPTFGTQYDAQFIESPNFDPGPFGPNQTWDFSNLQGQLDIHFNILDPNDAPESDKFPDASFVWNFVEFESFIFYSSNEDSISQMGSAVGNLTETTFLVINSDLEDGLQFPLTFGDSYDYHTEYDNYLFGNLLSSGQRDATLSADAYGTIITPYGTYENALRVKIITTEFGFNSTQYAWFDENNIIPILVFESSEDPEEPASLYFTDIDQVVATDEEMDDSSANVSYSYHTNSIKIKSHTPDKEIEGLYLLSIDGNLIQKEEGAILNNSFDEFTFKLRNKLNNGIYILKYTEDSVPRSASLFISG